jgi:DNA-binding NarL/FixJ family response regulator
MGMAWRALLADDHTMVREALSQMLERLDPTLKMSQAKDVDEVLGLLRAEPPYALLLLDYHMPGMNGRQTVEQIKKDFPQIAIGIITGYIGNDEVEPLIAAGCIGVFPKAMSGPSLLMAIKLAMSGQAYVPWSGDLTSSEFGRGNQIGPVATVPLPDLSDRQREVLTYVVGGAPNKEIARKLGLSEVTIKIHVASLCRKFSVANRTQLATAAMSAGIRPANA